MKRIEEKKQIIEELKSKGIDFTKNPMALPLRHEELLKEAAKKVNYKESRTSYYTLAKAFYYHLQKIIKRG